MDVEEYRRRFNSEKDSPGWDAINSALNSVHNSQEPKHWGTVIKHMLGGKDPLDGISAYTSSSGDIEHLHFCSYGFTSLYYDEESVGGDFSRFGFELIFRL